MNFNKLIFISILLLVIPFANAQCSYTTDTISCNSQTIRPMFLELTRPENAKGTIEYFSYTIPSTMRVAVTMTPGTKTAQGPDYDLYTSWTANTCPYNATYNSTDCGFGTVGAGIIESCSRWLNPLPAGNYWVAVHHYDGGCTGPNCGYTLNLTCQAITTTTTAGSTSTSTTTSTIPQNCRSTDTTSKYPTGDNPLLPGTTTDIAGNHLDTCISRGTLKEWYCPTPTSYAAYKSYSCSPVCPQGVSQCKNNNLGEGYCSCTKGPVALGTSEMLNNPLVIAAVIIVIVVIVVVIFASLKLMKRQ